MRVLLATYFTFFITFVGISQQVRFYATTDAKEVFTDSYFSVKFTIENSEGNSFTPPDFYQLKVVSGPSTSSKVSIINGVRSSKKSYSYTLIAKKPGVYTIEPAKITIGGKVYKSNTLKIKVRKRDKSKNPGNDTGEKFFVKAELSDSIAYPGQELVLKYKVYTSVDISNYRFVNESEYEGFIARELNVNQSQERRIIGDKEYVVYTLKTIALFPQKTGLIEIDPANIVISVPDARSRNVFFRSSKSYQALTNSLSVNVLPLPPKPSEEVSDNVGKFYIKAKIRKHRVTTDDALPLTIQIDGTGLGKFIEAPDIANELKDFEVYDPKLMSQKEYIMEGKLYSRKIFEYLLVPRKAGKYNLKFPYTYFDTDSAKYITIYAYPGTIQVSKGKNSGSVDRSKILEKYKLKPLKEDISLHRKAKPFFNTILYWLLLGIIFMSIPLMYLYRGYLIKQGNIDIAVVKRKRAAKEALRRLLRAKELMGQGDAKGFYKEISDALLKFVADKLDIPNIELNKDNVKSKLLSLGVSELKSEEYIDLLKECEVALYAGNPNENMKSIFEKTKDLITELELKI